MKRKRGTILAVVMAWLMLVSIALPSVAYAMAPNEVSVTVSATETVTAVQGQVDENNFVEGTYMSPDESIIIPDASGNGYTYNGSGENSTDVSLQGASEDLSVVQNGSTTNTIPNSAVTGADSTYDDTSINGNDIYLDSYTGTGDSYSTNNDAFYDGEGIPLSSGLPADSNAVTEDSSLVDAILESNGMEPSPENDYLIVVGDTTIEGDKTVKEVSVTDTNGNVLEGYEVTLEAQGTRTDQIFDSEGGVSISGKTNVVLSIDITRSMEDELGDSDVTKWEVLKEAATEFIDTVYGIERNESGDITNLSGLNTNVALSLVVYSGGKSNVVARTVTVSGSGDNVFTNDNVTELLNYFSSSASRSSLTGGTGMLNNGGTNAQAGYMETGELVQALIDSSGGSITGDNIHVVFMTDGEANTYYSSSSDTTTSIAYSGSASQKQSAGEKASKAAIDLLEKGISLHNVVINDSNTAANSIATYMDPNKSGGYFKGLLDANDPQGEVNYDNFDINYTWASTPEQIVETYKTIAKQIVNDAIVAEQARVIDVIPAGFDIYFVNGNTDLKVVGTDAQGNTVIEWYIDDLKNGVKESTRYFLVPNSTLGDAYTYGTAYTNDSAILYAKPVVAGGEEVAIVLDRPAIVLNPFADDDAVTENYTNNFSFNLLNGSSSGASGGSTYNLRVDSFDTNKLQAVGTTVSNTGVVSVTNAMIAGSSVPVTVDNAGNWVFENSQVRVTVKPDGTVAYEQLGTWPEAWGTNANITFDYRIGFTAEPNGITLIGTPDTASASASITLAKPTDTGGEDPGDDDDENIPLGPGGGAIPLSPGTIPLGEPNTGGGLSVSQAILATAVLIFAAVLLHRLTKKPD